MEDSKYDAVKQILDAEPKTFERAGISFGLPQPIITENGRMLHEVRLDDQSVRALFMVVSAVAGCVDDAGMDHIEDSADLMMERWRKWHDKAD